jgi:hypothetical protein
VAAEPTTATEPETSSLSQVVPILVGIGALGVVATVVDSSIKRTRKGRRRRAPARPSQSGPPRQRPPARPEQPVPAFPADVPAAAWSGTAGSSARARANELTREADRWRRGAEGEELVGRELDSLPFGKWWTFHDIEMGPNGVNVDHLVIGVAGVFTVNTKTSTGDVWIGGRAFLVNGDKTAYYPKATAEARHVGTRLSHALGREVDVWPVIALVAERVTVAEHPDDLTVVTSDEITSWLGALPERLTAEDAYDVVLAAYDRATWR